MSHRNRSGEGERDRCEPRHPSHPFPRRYRLTKTDEFSSVFGFRRAIKSRFFLLHWLERPDSAPAANTGARLGLVIGKKQLRRAVGRNLVKRLGREMFRLHRDSLPPVDLILRLGVSLDKGFSPVNPRPNRRELAAEIVSLLQRLARRLGKAASEAQRPPGGDPAASA